MIVHMFQSYVSENDSSYVSNISDQNKDKILYISWKHYPISKFIMCTYNNKRSQINLPALGQVWALIFLKLFSVGSSYNLYYFFCTPQGF